jgi:uncharacterized protein YkwD
VKPFRAALLGCLAMLGACSQSQTPVSPVAPAPAPASSVPAQAARSAPHWLTLLNQYRTANGLKPVVEDPALSAADRRHAQYLVKNQVGFSAGGNMHTEEKSNQWYSDQGYWAGHTGNVMLSSFRVSQSQAIEGWVGAPFHGLAMMAPDLHTSGFGSFCEASRCAAVLSTGHMSDLRDAAAIRDIPQFDYDSDAPEKRNKLVLETPVRWPAPGSSITDGGFNGREWPNPLSACPGYEPPTGVVIFASFGRDFVAEALPGSLTCNGAAVEHCIVNAKNYSSPDPTQVKSATASLKYFAAVLLIPRKPIAPGSTCEVSMTVEGAETRWSFSIRKDTSEVEDQ